MKRTEKLTKINYKWCILIRLFAFPGIYKVALENRRILKFLIIKLLVTAFVTTLWKAFRKWVPSFRSLRLLLKEIFSSLFKVIYFMREYEYEYGSAQHWTSVPDKKFSTFSFCWARRPYCKGSTFHFRPVIQSFSDPFKSLEQLLYLITTTNSRLPVPPNIVTHN